MEFRDRLKDWLKQKYGNINKAAIAFDMPPITLHRYTTGVNSPGMPFLLKLRELGCDINWLLTGETQDEHLKKMQDEIEELKKEKYHLLDRTKDIFKVAESIKQYSALNKKQKRK